MKYYYLMEKKMDNDEIITEAAKSILLDRGLGTVLGEGHITGVRWDMPTQQINFGSQMISMPTRPTVSVDVAWDITPEQLTKLQLKVMSPGIRVLIVDGDKIG